MEGLSSNHFLAVSKFLLILISLSSYINTSSAAARHAHINPKTRSTEFIRMSCSATTYPKLCFNSLSTHASLIQTSPKLLAHAALNVTLAKAKSTTNLMLQLSKRQGMKPREVVAMRDCVEELSDTADELGRSIVEMGQIKRPNFELIMSDLETWVSAALTDENTCTDGFDQGNEMNGNVKKVVRRSILKIAHLTSNALALINRYASLHN